MARRVGRPTKFGDKRAAAVLRAVRAGNYLETAARLAGVDQATLHRWMAREEPMFREFREAVEKARSEAEARDVRSVGRAAAKTWKAAAWRLERRNPTRWGPRVTVMVREAFEAALARLEAQLDAATFERVAHILAGLDGESELGETPAAEPGGAGDPPR
jgi:hypothetical protein